MPQKAKRIFYSSKEFEVEAEKATKIAVEKTLEKLKKILKDEYVKPNIYDIYKPQWYKRTNSLLDESSIEVYIYKNTKDKIGGGIRFNPNYYNNHSERENFQHGNEIGFLPMGSFLEIMNDSSLLSAKNPYHFPVIERGHFYDDFNKYAEEAFDEIFKEYFTFSMIGTGYRPKAHSDNITNKISTMNLSSSTSGIKSYRTSNLT